MSDTPKKPTKLGEQYAAGTVSGRHLLDWQKYAEAIENQLAAAQAKISELEDNYVSLMDGHNYGEPQ